MTRQEEAINREFHPEAKDLVKERVDEFATSLILQAKLFAYQQDDPYVVKRHVDEAFEALQTSRKQTWGKELLMIIGGTLFGAFVPGFITELSSGTSTLLLIVYTILGFTGMLLVFLALIRG